MTGVRTGRTTLVHEDGTPEEVAFAQVTPNLFRVLGVRIVLGRDFIDSDGLPQPVAADGALPPPGQRPPTYAIVSQEFFQRHFGGNPAMLGKPLAKGGAIMVGVLERGFELLFRRTRTSSAGPIISPPRAWRTAIPGSSSPCA